MSRCRTHTARSAVPAPLRLADQASEVISCAASAPVAPETVCLLVDDAYLPLACVVVEGAGAPDDVFSVLELVLELARSCPVAHVALASCRPDHPVEPADLDRWHEIDARLEDGGVGLLEWFVRDRSTMVAVTPLAGEVPRWPG